VHDTMSDTAPHATCAIEVGAPASGLQQPHAQTHRHVCVCVPRCVCVYECMILCMHASMHACLCHGVCMYVSMYACIMRHQTPTNLTLETHQDLTGTPDAPNPLPYDCVHKGKVCFFISAEKIRLVGIFGGVCFALSLSLSPSRSLFLSLHPHMLV